MSIKAEEVKEIPLIYPLISVTMRTVAWVNGRGIESECQELLNMDALTPEQAAAAVVLLLGEFEKYVSKVAETANSPAGKQELQSILDEHARPVPPPSEGPPLTLPPVTDQGMGMAPSDPLVP